MRNRKKSVIIGLMVVLSLLIGGSVITSKRCIKPSSPPNLSDVGTGSENFILHVLNSSKNHPSVDIKVYIDGKIEVDDRFISSHFDTGPLSSIAPHKTYRFQLGRGNHTIKAISTEGSASLERDFKITGKHGGLLGFEYWSGEGEEPLPNHFGFVFQDRFIYFE